MEALIQANALNQTGTGNVDYNKCGKLDGIGFEKVSDKFVDNFLLCVLVPDYNTEKKKKIRRNTFIGSQNKICVNIYTGYGVKTTKPIYFVDNGGTF